MPRSLPVRPRKILPPPTTMTTSTPSWRTSPIWQAMSWIASGQIPTPDSPPSASPLSLSRMRRYFGGVAWVINWRGCSNRPAPSQIKAKADRNGGHFSVFEPPPSETPSSKHHAPNTKHQAPEKSRYRNTKNQAPNTKEIPSSKLQTAARASSLELGVWCLGPGASLELGV